MLGLRRVAWARQVDSLRLMPTSAQMGLIDKRFGGALSKEDVLVRCSCDVDSQLCASRGMRCHGTAAAKAVKQEASHTFYRSYMGEGVKQSGPEAHCQSRMCLTRGSRKQHAQQALWSAYCPRTNMW